MSDAEAVDRTPESDPARRLRDLRKEILGIGKRGVGDVLDLGAAFEAASVLLSGKFEAWVLQECRIDPRTVRGYRRAHRVLGDRRDLLVEAGVSPTVVVRLASMPIAARQRALAAIGSGRSMKLSDLASLAADARPCRDGSLDWIGKAATASARAFGRDLQSLLSEIRDAVLTGDPEGLAAAAGATPALLPAIDALLSAPYGGPGDEGRRLAAALRTFAESLPGADRESAASAVLELSSGHKGPAADVAKALPARPAPDHGRHVPKSIFEHGLKALEICAGAGGQALGLARAGFHHVALVERNASACGTLSRAFPDIPVIEQDLRSYRPDGIDDLDLLAGGVPCQPYSQEGLRQGRYDARDLFPVAVDLVAALRPRAVMLENVEGILNRRFDGYRREILGNLGELGYRCEWRKVHTSHFGVPQSRVRSVLVGFREPGAMSRFVWPTSRAWHAEHPWTMGSALLGHIESKWYKMPEETAQAMDRLAPTAVGGSDRKRGTGLGRENSLEAWGERGISDRPVGGVPPAHDHTGPIRLTLEMWAELQDFPQSWPFPDAAEPKFRQVGNAFPPVVALYLGCAVASALDGRTFDPDEQIHAEVWRNRKHWLLGGRSANRKVPAAEDGTTVAEAGPAVPKRGIKIPFDRLRATSSVGDREEWNPTFEAPGPPDPSPMEGAETAP